MNIRYTKNIASGRGSYRSFERTEAESTDIRYKTIASTFVRKWNFPEYLEPWII